MYITIWITHLLHIISSLCAGFDEHNIQLLRFSLALLGRYLSLVGQIRFVADQHDNHIGAPFCAHVVDPFRGLVKRIRVWKRFLIWSNYNIRYYVRWLTCNIVDNHCDRWVANVRRNERAKTFLASSIPQLQTHRAIFQVHGFRKEIYSYCCLKMRTGKLNIFSFTEAS